MTQHPALRTSLFLLCLSVAAVAHAQTQAPAKPFEPQVGQAGKDVVWVPTPPELVIGPVERICVHVVPLRAQVSRTRTDDRPEPPYMSNRLSTESYAMRASVRALGPLMPISRHCTPSHSHVSACRTAPIVPPK